MREVGWRKEDGCAVVYMTQSDKVRMSEWHRVTCTECVKLLVQQLHAHV